MSIALTHLQILILEAVKNQYSSVSEIVEYIEKLNGKTNAQVVRRNLTSLENFGLIKKTRMIEDQRFTEVMITC